MLQYTAVNGTNLTGQLASDGLGYVMIDGGPDYPYGAYVFQPKIEDLGIQGLSGLADFGAEAPPPTPPTTTPEPKVPSDFSNKQLLTALYTRNKYSVWIGGGLVGVLALTGLFSIIRR